jgi:hypothetical protein
LQSSELGVTPQDIFNQFVQSSELGVTLQYRLQQFMQSSELGVTLQYRLQQFMQSSELGVTHDQRATAARSTLCHAWCFSVLNGLSPDDMVTPRQTAQ